MAFLVSIMPLSMGCPKRKPPWLLGLEKCQQCVITLHLQPLCNYDAKPRVVTHIGAWQSERLLDYHKGSIRFCNSFICFDYLDKASYFFVICRVVCLFAAVWKCLRDPTISGWPQNPKLHYRREGVSAFPWNNCSKWLNFSVKHSSF